jgi:hypothetical protein
MHFKEQARWFESNNNATGIQSQALSMANVDDKPSLKL